jgi:predicted transcriptional regulator
MKPKNVKKYDKYDLLIVLYYILKNSQIGRKQISNLLGLGEGSVKSILSQLAKKDLIEKNSQGNIISDKGKDIIEEMLKEIEILENLDYDIFIDGYKPLYLILKKHDKKKLENIYFARDYAIREGCWSAMILFFDGKDIKLNQFEKLNFNALRDRIEIKKDQLIIVVSSSNLRTSYKGLFRIIEFLNVEFNNILKYFE